MKQIAIGIPLLLGSYIIDPFLTLGLVIGLTVGIIGQRLGWWDD